MDVLQAINELSQTIIHFSGHGSDTDEIIFQNEAGETKAVSKDAIVQTMMASSGNIRLVFFNTCYSHNQARAVTQHVEKHSHSRHSGGYGMRDSLNRSHCILETSKYSR